MNTPIRTELMPGVWLTAVQTRKFKTSCWSLQMLAPLRRETAALNALLPRVLCQGTAHCPDQELLGAALDRLYGGAVGPIVSRRGEIHCIGLQGAFLDDALTPDGAPIFPQAAELMGDLLLRPATRNGRLRAEYVDGERKNLLGEMRSVQNNRRQYAALRLEQEMCREEPFGAGRLGSPEAAAKIKVKHLDRHYRDLLAESRMELYYCGSASPEEVRQAWTEALMGLPRRGRPALPETLVNVVPETVREVTETAPVRQTRLALGFRTGCGIDSRRYPALRVTNALLGVGHNSRLFTRLREERSLCYAVSSSLEVHKGLIVVQCGVSGEQADAARDEILRQVEALKAGAFTAAELDAARRGAAHRLRTVPDSQAAMGHFWLDQAIAETPCTPEELARLVSEVTAEQVTECAGQIALDTVYRLTGEAEQEG
ncbi:MAG: insulinase family protein [Clostridiales bacterium]|nr:insulinase family protein [Clostridiales bacterium]